MVPLTQELVVFFILVLCLAFMGFFLFVGWLLTTTPKEVKCPYTGVPVRSCETLPRETKKRVYLYMQSLHQYDNQPFLFKKAVISRETGRIFTNCINWRGKITLDWGFLQKRYVGTWVSWGSLSDVLKQRIEDQHENLEGFQTEFSCVNPSPRQVDPKSARLKPGPLYVDLETGVLLGWKQVPETFVEVLIVQKPTRTYGRKEK